jgi:hypothetical protein
MIDLSQSPLPTPQVHAVPTDPGASWGADADVAIDAAPDGEVDPLPEARWAPHALRTGVYGAVGPRVIALPGGGYRLYYTQILPRRGHPAGANDYDNATTRILSATSSDGSNWTAEPGVRLSPRDGGAGAFRVVSSEVVPMGDAVDRLRMYYECCGGPQSTPNSIRSAASDDGGLVWAPEPAARFGNDGGHYMSPRIVFLDDDHCRLYCCAQGQGIISAMSRDGGLTFRQEPGVRIAQDGTYDAMFAFAPEIVRPPGGGYMMYYAGYGSPHQAHILRATSDDGLTWCKELGPVIAPGNSRWDAAKCSEMCLFRLPSEEGHAPRYRMVYEACDGTAQNARGVWRIAGATSVA